MAKYNFLLYYILVLTFGVSLNDMFTNIKASGTPSVLYFVPFMFSIFYNFVENQFSKLHLKNKNKTISYKIIDLNINVNS
jgi:hypothetical protein